MRKYLRHGMNTTKWLKPTRRTQMFLLANPD